MTSTDPRDVPSPCIGVCQLDPAGEVCLGCRRTVPEITRWSVLTAAQKRAILARVRPGEADGGPGSAPR